MTRLDRHPARLAREASGLLQSDVAARVGISRQALGAIEAGRTVPAVDVAVRLARALGTSVEAIFGDAGARVHASSASSVAPPGGRVALSRVGAKWVAHPLGRDALRFAADAWADPDRPGTYSLARAADEVAGNAFIVGCAPALGMLADHLNARSREGRHFWFGRSSAASLDALAAGHAHVAGTHLVDEESGDENLPEVRRAACPFPVRVVTLARWQVGLVTVAGNPLGIRGVVDLARPGLRVMSREAGAGARRVLDHRLRSHGVPVELPGTTTLVANGHLESAQAVHVGAADVGLASRDTAIVLGLHFVPLADERFDLAFDARTEREERVIRVLDALVGAPVRRDLAALGYDVRESGRHVADVAA